MSHKSKRKKPLVWAAIHGNKDLARAMLRLCGNDSWHSDYTHSHEDLTIWAAEAGHSAIVKMRLEDDPGMIHSDRWYDGAVNGAGSGEHMEFLDLLLNASAPVPERIRDITRSFIHA